MTYRRCLNTYVVLFYILFILFGSYPALIVSKSSLHPDKPSFNFCCKNLHDCNVTINDPLDWFRLTPVLAQNCNDELEVTMSMEEHYALEDKIYMTVLNGADAGLNISVLLSDMSITLSGSSRLPFLQLSNSSYCFHKSSSDNWLMNICLTRNEYPTYRKCCPWGNGYHPTLGCVAVNISESFPPVDLNYVSEKKRFQTVIEFPNCEHPTLISTALTKYKHPRAPYFVMPHQVKYLSPNELLSNEWTLATSKYCIDLLVLREDEVDATCSDEADVLLLCDEEKQRDVVETSQFFSLERLRWLYVGFLAISITFLMLTATGQIILKENRNIHKCTVHCYVWSQLVFYIFLIIIYLNQLLDFLSHDLCIYIGIITHWCGIATFSWLSVINFDLWWTFRVLEAQSQNRIYWKKLLWYTAFATMVPAFIVGVTLGLYANQKELTCRRDFADRGKPDVPPPVYGKDLCFLSNEAQLEFFYPPLGVLLLANVIFYSCTSYRLCSLNKRNQTGTSRTQQQSCQLLLKLFFVTGTVWVLQVVHALIELPESKWYWVLSDIMGMFQPVAIFIIFMCRRETIKAFSIKYPLLAGICCCFTGQKGLYRKTTLTDRSTDGSTKISRTESYYNKGNTHHHESWQEPQEIIQLP